jgi:hypothetical protein
MADKSATNENEVSCERLAELLNEDLAREDLAREYQAIIGYVSIPKCSLAPNTWTSPRSSKSTPSRSSTMP